MPEAVDESLVLAAQAGDRTAFGILYSRYRRMLHGILLAHARPSDVEDLMQDAFLQAMERIAALRQPEAFGGWLARIARNLATDHQRRRRHDECDATDSPAQRPPDEAAFALEAIRQLPLPYRETLILRLVEGMTGPEIASRTGLSEGSVRVNLCRGMKLLRERLGVKSNG